MKKFLWAVLFFAFIFFLTACQNQSSMAQQELTINNQKLIVEVAKTMAEQAQGLSGRQKLCDNCGLLFEFPDYKVRNFHMKDMNFALDIIWIKDNQIVGFEENVPVLTTDGQFSQVKSNTPVNRVLEVKAGWVRENGVEVGEVIDGLD